MVGIFYGSSNLRLASEWMGGSVVNSRWFLPSSVHTHEKTFKFQRLKIGVTLTYPYSWVQWNMGVFPIGSLPFRYTHISISSFSTSRIMGERAFERSCWWTKCCTTDDDNPIIYRVLTIPVGCLGFLPSTVSSTKSLPVQSWWPLIQRKSRQFLEMFVEHIFFFFDSLQLHSQYLG